MKKVLILADSLSLPRLNPEVCEYEHTWPYLLKKEYQVHQVSIGGGTISDLVRQIEYHKLFRPDVIILQCGIVDCAPRALGIFELEMIKKIWGVRAMLLPFIKRNSSAIRKYRNKTYTSPSVFLRSLKEIKAAVPTAIFFGIGILPTSSEYERKVPGITQRVDQFNAILANFLKDYFISVSAIDRELIMTDYIHLNARGQKFIYEKLITHITSA
jgi:lysophospholipase L1-like esterase